MSCLSIVLKQLLLRDSNPNTRQTTLTRSRQGKRDDTIGLGKEKPFLFPSLLWGLQDMVYKYSFGFQHALTSRKNVRASTKKHEIVTSQISILQLAPNIDRSSSILYPLYSKSVLSTRGPSHQIPRESCYKIDRKHVHQCHLSVVDHRELAGLCNVRNLFNPIVESKAVKQTELLAVLLLRPETYGA